MAPFKGAKYFPFKLDDVVLFDAETFLEAVQQHATAEVDDRLASGIPAFRLWHDAYWAWTKYEYLEPEEQYLKTVRKELGGRMAETIANIKLKTPDRAMAAASPSAPAMPASAAETALGLKAAQHLPVTAAKRSTPPSTVDDHQLAEFRRRCEHIAVRIGNKE